MSKVEELRDDILSESGFDETSMAYEKLQEGLTKLIQAVRTETEKRVWGLIEKICAGYGTLYQDDRGWCLNCISGQVIVAKTARETILAAAKELGIAVDDQT